MTMTHTGKMIHHTGQTRRISKLATNFWLLGVLIVLAGIIAWIRPQFADSANLVSMLRAFSIMAVMVMGLTLVFAAGQIDVSFMQIAALANMSCAALLAIGWGWPGAIMISLGIGLGVGLLNGFLVSVMRLPALIVTISMAGICASAAAALGKGTVIRIADGGPVGWMMNTTIAGIVPVVVLPVLALALVVWFVQERLAMGRYIYAMAQNEAAVRAVGVPVTRLTILLFALSGLCAAMAGVMLAGSLSSGQPMIGGPFLINGLTVVLLGGMMVHVGKPNIAGTLTATLFIGVLFSGAALLGIPDYQRQIIQGVLLAAGLGVATWSARHHNRTSDKVGR